MTDPVAPVNLASLPLPLALAGRRRAFKGAYVSLYARQTPVRDLARFGALEGARQMVQASDSDPTLPLAPPRARRHLYHHQRLQSIRPEPEVTAKAAGAMHEEALGTVGVAQIDKVNSNVIVHGDTIDARAENISAKVEFDFSDVQLESMAYDEPPLVPLSRLILKKRDEDGIPCTLTSMDMPMSPTSMQSWPYQSFAPTTGASKSTSMMIEASIFVASPAPRGTPTMSPGSPNISAPVSPIEQSSMFPSFSFEGAASPHNAHSDAHTSTPIIASAVAGGFVVLLTAVALYIIRKRVVLAKRRARALSSFEPESWLDKGDIENVFVKTPSMTHIAGATWTHSHLPDVLGVFAGGEITTEKEKESESHKDRMETSNAQESSTCSSGSATSDTGGSQRSLRRSSLAHLLAADKQGETPYYTPNVSMTSPALSKPETPTIERKRTYTPLPSITEPPKIFITDHPQKLVPPTSPTEAMNPFLQSTALASTYIGFRSSSKEYESLKSSSSSGSVKPPRPAKAAARNIASELRKSVSFPREEELNSVLEGFGDDASAAMGELPVPTKMKHRVSREWETARARVRARRSLTTST